MFRLQLSKFLRSMQDRGFVKIKDQKGVESITEIHKDHPEYVFSSLSKDVNFFSLFMLSSPFFWNF